MNKNMNHIKLSIITPCFNSALTIEKTLESVQRQNHEDIEHIIIDGGSTDATLDIIRRYSQNVPYEVKVVSEPDNGLYDAMNKGIRMSSGQFAGIINSDDWYEDNAFKLIDKVITASEASDRSRQIIYGMIRTYDADRLKTIEFYHHDFLLDRMINHPGCFVSKALYDEIGLFDTSFRSSADYEWMKRAMDAGADFKPVYEVLANVRLGGMSSSNIGFRETLKLQYKWGRVSRTKYIAYTVKSHIGDLIKKLGR